MSKRDRGEGNVEQRGKNSWRLRYRIGKKPFKKNFRGTRADALKELRRLLHAGDTGAHVAPDKLTFGAWAEHWISIGCPGKRRTEGKQRTVERYAQLLNHVALNDRPLQEIQASEIDAIYVQLADRLAPMTLHHVHTVLGACFGAAVRTRKLTRNPMLELAKVPSPGEGDHGSVLDAEQMIALIRGFNRSAIFPIVATLGGTGARRNEVLALRVSDLDPIAKTLRIERALDETEKYGLRIKAPKTERGKRTIEIDDGLMALLLQQRDKLLRIKAGVADRAAVDLSLVRLPKDALVFPNPPQSGASFSFTALRNPRNTSKEFKRKATALGFTDLRLHDLRGSHATILLDAGKPVHVVAQRLGHDPAVLLRNYAKRTRKADTAVAADIGKLLKGAY
jgi:integrase